MFELALDDFCNFAHGLYRYDEKSYFDWLNSNRTNAIAYLMWHTDTLSIELSDDTVSIQFFLSGENEDGPSKQAVSRLQRMRTVFPHCHNYNSRGIWLLAIVPEHDGSIKTLSRDSLPVQSDVQRNIIWRESAENLTTPEGYYEYQQRWYVIREQALLFVITCSKCIKRTFEGHSVNWLKEFDNWEVSNQLADLLAKAPHPPRQTPESMRECLVSGGDSWAVSMQTLRKAFENYLLGKDEGNPGFLAVYNCADCLDRIKLVHEGFAQVFDMAPDYFGMQELNSKELSAITELSDWFDAFITDIPTTPQKNVLSFVRKRRDDRRRDLLTAITVAIEHLVKGGASILLPSDVYIRDHIRFLLIAFSVSNPTDIDSSIEPLVKCLLSIPKRFDLLVLIPTFQDALLMDGGIQINLDDLHVSFDGTLMSSKNPGTFALSPEAMALLPPIPLPPKNQVQLLAYILPLLLGLQHLEQYYDEVRKRALDASLFEDMIRQRDLGRLQGLGRDLYNVGSLATKYVQSTFVDSSDPDCTLLLEFLSIFPDDTDEAHWERAFQFGRLNSSKVSEAAERLAAQQARQL